MKILVCVKQVPESAAGLRLDEPSGTIVVDASAGFRMNRFDEFAVEEAIRIKEKRADTAVDILSVGPPESSKVIVRALGMGANRGIHVITGAQHPLCPHETAGWICTHAGGRKYDLVLAGAMAEDDMHAQVGPIVAEMLSMPCATWVIRVDLAADGRTVQVERETSGNARERAELDLPAVLTIQMGINRPRYPSLGNLMRAHREPLKIISTADPLTHPRPVPRQTVVRTGYPGKTRSGMVLQGSRQEKAARLVEILRERALLG